MTCVYNIYGGVSEEDGRSKVILPFAYAHSCIGHGNHVY